MKPVPLSTIAKRLNGKDVEDQVVIQGFAIDSRLVKPGDLFCALPGKRVDGHRFLQEAAERGAVGALVTECYQGEDFGLSLIPVPDVLASLQEYARKILKKRKTQVIAITGSLGKTTTKEFTHSLLAAQYKVACSPKSYNSRITLPLSILMAEGDEDFLILEMGMTEPGEIRNLVSMAPPDLGVITTVAVQHATHFPQGLAGIAREKSEVFAHPQTKTGILNRDMPYFEEVVCQGVCEKITFSCQTRDSDFFYEPFAEGVRLYPKGEKPQEISLSLPLAVHMQNFVAAAIGARLSGVSWERIREVAPTLRLPSMRFERIEKKGILFINDAYNANPDSMKAALEGLPKPGSGRKRIAVLSEMDALGAYSDEGHAAIAESALCAVDLLLCIGERCAVMERVWHQKGKPVRLFDTKEELGESLKTYAEPGDVVLLKGARAYALEKLLEIF